jgi:hypothetical protein
MGDRWLRVSEQAAQQLTAAQLQHLQLMQLSGLYSMSLQQ